MLGASNSFAATYYSLFMEATRPRRARRRPRRGTVEQPVDVRLVRNAFAAVAAALLVAAFTVTRPGALAPSALPPSFDTAAATALAQELERDYPQRTPGTPAARDAAAWFSSKLAPYGLTTTTNAWQASLPGLGSVELRNVVATIPGTTSGSIVLVAYRDNAPGARLGNTSGTAALIELARAYGRSETAGSAVRPRHTLVFVSTDAGSYGGLGAAHFADASPLARTALAVVTLDEIAGGGAVRLRIDGNAPRSPAPALVRTAAARLAAETGSEPRWAGWLEQLVDLGTPFGLGEQAPFLGAEVSALRITTVGDGRREQAASNILPLRVRRFGEVGRASQALLAALDGGIEIVPQTPSYLYLGDRLVRGWATELVLLAALIPFAVGVVDLLARCRRLRVPLAPSFRALRARLGLALWLGVLIAAATAVGALPDTPSLPLPASLPAATSVPTIPCLTIAILTGLGWALMRRSFGPANAAAAEHELAGYAAALTALGLLAGITAVVNPFALVFLLPSLFTWLWLPALVGSAGWKRDVVYGLGLIGPVLFLVVTAERLELGLGVLPYTLRLFTSGYLSLTTALLLLAWVAVAAQLGALTGGRYAPYAGGVSPPPPGAIRSTTARIASWRQSSRRNLAEDPAGTTPSPRST